MFPPILQPVEKFLQVQPPRQRNKKAPRLKWRPTYQLLSIQPPIALTKEKYKKAFKIRFKYRSNPDGKLGMKTILFGGDNEYVNNHDEKLRATKHSRLSHQHDPFHPNYWTLQILNTQPTVIQAYTRLVQKLMRMKQ